jgi:hypothetical protein
MSCHPETELTPRLPGAAGQLRVTTDTGLTAEADLQVSSDDHKAAWLILDE